VIALAHNLFEQSQGIEDADRFGEVLGLRPFEEYDRLHWQGLAVGINRQLTSRRPRLSDSMRDGGRVNLGFAPRQILGMHLRQDRDVTATVRGDAIVDIHEDNLARRGPGNIANQLAVGAEFVPGNVPLYRSHVMKAHKTSRNGLIMDEIW
jgi:hypothetical protein